MADCDHDPRFAGVFLMSKLDHGCVACGFERVSAEIEVAVEGLETIRDMEPLSGVKIEVLMRGCASAALSEISAPVEQPKGSFRAAKGILSDDPARRPDPK